MKIAAKGMYSRLAFNIQNYYKDCILYNELPSLPERIKINTCIKTCIRTKLSLKKCFSKKLIAIEIKNQKDQ